MTRGTPERPLSLSRRATVGAVLGATAGPAAGFGATWSGVGDGGLHVWLIATLVAAILGGLAWPVFVPDGTEGCERPGPGFAALFGGTVGLLAGAFAAFPIGGVLGGAGGVVGGAGAAFCWGRMAGSPLPARALAALMTGVGLALGLAVLVTR